MHSGVKQDQMTKDQLYTKHLLPFLRFKVADEMSKMQT